jgi:hypothetical protein
MKGILAPSFTHLYVMLVEDSYNYMRTKYYKGIWEKRWYLQVQYSTVQETDIVW